MAAPIQPSISDGTVVGACGISEKDVQSQSGQSVIMSESVDESVQKQEKEVEYPKGTKLVLIVLALCLSVFVMALDNSIITTAIPRITDEFRSLSDVGWYGSSYLLATAALQLTFGKLYSFFSIKRVFILTITVFEIGNLICGVARSSLALIAGRAVAGIGAAGIFAGALIILAHIVPLKKRPLYHGCIGSMWGWASLAGPLVGGIFTDRVNWRLCFLINIPMGVITLAVIILCFPDPKRDIPPAGWRYRLSQMDPIGTAIFIPSVVAFFLVLQWGGTAHPWNSPRIIALFVVSGLGLVSFLFVQRWQNESATVPPRIFCQRSVWTASFFAFNTGAAYLIGQYFLPIWFQAVRGASAVESGFLIMPLLMSVVVLSVLAGSLVTYCGYYAPFMVAGSILMSVGFGLFYTLSPSTSTAATIGFQTLAGAGIGLGLQQPLMAIQTVLRIEDVPTGTAIVIFCQTMGAALAVALGQTVFTNELVAGMRRLVPTVSPQIVLEIGATSIQSGEVLPKETLPAVTMAYNDALRQAFLASAVLAVATCFGSFMIEWRSVKGKRTTDDEQGGSDGKLRRDG